MRPVFILSFMVILSTAAAGADISFMTSDTLNFGDVESGTVLKGEIQFVNTGNDQVRIKRVNTSCGCTAAHIDKMFFEPGETATIPFSLNTRGFRNKVVKSISVEFENNDPATKTILLMANCINFLDITPRYLTFTRIQVNPDTSIVKEVRLMNRYNKPFTLDRIITDADVELQYIKKDIDPGDDYLFQVILNPKAPMMQNTQILIESSDPGMEKLRIPIYISVKDQ
ncbi:DUF1573 domain-containing protein [bacterium]|nr:DUF1573 domain-containing protein [bacterium]